MAPLKEGEDAEATEVASVIPPPPPPPNNSNDYIKGSDKFPIEPGQWGYLPGELQLLFHDANVNCTKLNATTTSAKCLLHHGMERSDHQSFVACLSDLLYFGLSKNETKSIAQMCQQLIQSLDLDLFIKLQNGNLVSEFSHSFPFLTDTQLNKYNTTATFKRVRLNRPAEKAYLCKVVQSFESFIRFLGDPSAKITHTFLWDLVCTPNPALFEKGLNLVLFDIPRDDITNNVKLMCPSNAYSMATFDKTKPTAILIHIDDYYEPVYLHQYLPQKSSMIVKLFESSSKEPQLVRLFNTIILPYFETACKPISSLPNMYSARRSLYLMDLLHHLKNMEYKVHTMVMNFQNKIIGVMASMPGGKKGLSKDKGFIPCYPMAIPLTDIHVPVVFIDDAQIWKSYNSTVDFLRELAQTPIKYAPSFKVMENNVVVGILTNTNQFVQVHPIAESEIDADHNLRTFRSPNLIRSDTELAVAHEDEQDEERIKIMNDISTDAQLYRSFRDLVRIFINEPVNSATRNELDGLVRNRFMHYSLKMQYVEKLLESIAGHHIKEEKEGEGEKEGEKEGEGEKNSNTLVLPTHSLVTGKPLKASYFTRLSDELVRYARIRPYMFHPTTYLSLDPIGLHLLNTEILVMQFMLTTEYFDNLNAMANPTYVKQTTHDVVEPADVPVFPLNVDIELTKEPDKLSQAVCETTINAHITSGRWKKCFGSKYVEKVYGTSPVCTYELISDISKKALNKPMSVMEIKLVLFNEYTRWIRDHKAKLMDIFIKEGKKMPKKAELFNFSSYIYTDEYYLTPFDLWLLSHSLQLPMIFISQFLLIETNYTDYVFAGYGQRESNFAYIFIPSLHIGVSPPYKLVINASGNCMFPISQTMPECSARLARTLFSSTSSPSSTSSSNKSIESYLTEYSFPVKISKLVVAENDVYDKDNEPAVNPNLNVNELIITKQKTVRKPRVMNKNNKTAKR